EIIYNTDPAELPYLQLSLRDIPDGTFSGTLTGAYEMLGDIEGTATLELSMSGDIEESGAGGIQRVVGTTQVTGVARSGDGTYEGNSFRCPAGRRPGRPAAAPARARRSVGRPAVSLPPCGARPAARSRARSARCRSAAAGRSCAPGPRSSPSSGRSTRGCGRARTSP